MTYLVVVNAHQQYSIWPDDMALPGGWSEAGVTGSKDECLAHILRPWTELRPWVRVK